MATRAKDDARRAQAKAEAAREPTTPAPQPTAEPPQPSDGDGPLGAAYGQLMTRLRQPASVLALVLVLILGYTAVTRLEGLGRKPYHHDESIHALHSYNLYQGDGWQYDPVYHGPVVYYFNALAYFLFGDSDSTARLMPAVFGILMVLLALCLVREIGLLESLYAAGFIALSPTLYYFSRFVRDDVYGGCWQLMLLLAALRYHRLQDPRWLYLGVVALAMAFCSKINALIIGFVFCSALLLYGAWYVLDGPAPGEDAQASGGPPWMVRLRSLVVRNDLVVRGLWLFGTVVLAVAGYIVAVLPPYPAIAGARPLYWIVASVLIGAGLVGLDRLVQRWKSDLGMEAQADGMYERHRMLLLMCLLFLSIFAVLYTNVFKLVPLPGGRDVSLGRLLGNGVFNGLHYWWGQQLNPRIADVWYYYVPRLFVYELPLMVLVLLGSFVRLTDRQRGVLIVGLLVLVVADWKGLTGQTIGEDLGKNSLTFMELSLFVGLLLVGGFLGIDDLRRGRPDRALVLYWAILNFIIYAKANEKVPWLGVHVVLPVAVYAGMIAADLHRHLASFARRPTRRLAAGAGVLAVLYSVHAGVILNVHNEADPREIMVYVQSTTDVLDVRDELEQIAFREGTYYQTKFTVEDEASWPFSWYLRRYKNVGHPNSISNLDGATAAVLTNFPPADHTRALLENNGYEGTRYRLRAWWQPNWELDAAEAKDGLRGYFRYLAKMLRYVTYRQTFPPDLGSTDFMFYRRAPVAAVSPRTGDGAAQPVEERPRLPESIVAQPIVEPQLFGSQGSAAGQFQQPRGVATGPDGSLYVVDSANDRVQRFNAAGQFLSLFGSSGNGQGQFKQPGGIAVDAQGFVYVADTWNHRIQKFTADGQFQLTWGDEEQFYGPRDVTVSRDGRVFVTDTGHHKVVAFSASGEYLREWGVKGTRYRQFTEPVGLALGPDDTLYVADTGNRRIQAFDLDGNFLRSMAIAGWEYIYSEPYLAVDGADRLWLTDSKNGRVQAYSTKGRFLGALGGQGSLQTPVGIASGADGFLYVADVGRHAVVKLPLAGQPVGRP